MGRSRLVATRSVAGTFVVGMILTSAAAATDLNFDFKVNQGAVSTSFATLALDQFVPGTTTFTLDTVLTGGAGNPGIIELLFGCNGCGTPTIIPGRGVTVGPGGTQAGYNFDYRVSFNPSALKGNTPLTWTATSPPATFLESTSGAGPNAFAIIQLTGGAQVIGTQNVTSGFYIAAVPEPSQYAMMAVGLAIVAIGLRRRKQRALLL